MNNATIISDPEVMMGKPVVAGTRITVELNLERLAAGESVEQLLESASATDERGRLGGAGLCQTSASCWRGVSCGKRIPPRLHLNEDDALRFFGRILLSGLIFKVNDYAAFRRISKARREAPAYLTALGLTDPEMPTWYVRGNVAAVALRWVGLLLLAATGVFWFIGDEK